jgi:hypothetical protein
MLNPSFLLNVPAANILGVCYKLIKLAFDFKSIILLMPLILVDALIELIEEFKTLGVLSLSFDSSFLSPFV